MEHVFAEVEKYPTTTSLFAPVPGTPMIAFWRDGECFGMMIKEQETKHRCGMDMVPDVIVVPVNGGRPLPVEGRDSLRDFAKIGGWVLEDGAEIQEAEE